MLSGTHALDTVPPFSPPFVPPFAHPFTLPAGHSGKMHQLEAQLAMAKDFAAELRTNLLELEDHCCMLDEVG